MLRDNLGGEQTIKFSGRLGGLRRGYGAQRRTAGRLRGRNRCGRPGGNRRGPEFVLGRGLVGRLCHRFRTFGGLFGLHGTGFGNGLGYRAFWFPASLICGLANHGQKQAAGKTGRKNTKNQGTRWQHGSSSAKSLHLAGIVDRPAPY